MSKESVQYKKLEKAALKKAIDSVDQELTKWSKKYPYVRDGDAVRLAMEILEKVYDLPSKRWGYIYKSLEYKRRAFE